MPHIVFQPSNKAIDVPPGVTLADAVRAAGFRLSTPCGGKGLCGKCRVRVIAGDVGIDAGQQRCLPPELLADGWRAACIVNDYPDLVIADPEAEANNIVLTDFAGRDGAAPDGLWRLRLSLAKPSAADQTSDAARLEAALAAAGRDGARIAPDLLRRIPGILRETDFSPEAIGLGCRLLTLRKPDDPAPLLGLAVDLGTTTLAAALCDLETGDVLALASRANPQSLRGDDVISRIDHAARGPDEQRELRALAADAIESMADDARRQAGLGRTELLTLAVGGNTVMNHLLLGVDPRPLAVSPFIPCFRTVEPVAAGEIGWRTEPAPLVVIVPNIAAYVGGDITAGVVAHGVAEGPGTVLFLDIGTNGEIVLRANGKTYACAAAAGPAFEGARIGQGMRAAPGAVCRVDATPEGDLDIGVVDSLSPARGVCGTGLLDAAAVLRKLGAIDEGGRLLDPDEARDADVPAPLRQRLFEDDAGSAVWLERPADGSPGVRLTQRDIRELQLAKGAIAAGVRVLLGVAGLAPEGVDEVLLAGGFGNYLRPESALGVGILPAGVAVAKIRSVGNASLAGTRLCLLSEQERRRAETLSAAIEYVELSGRDDFQSAFAEEMLFPEN